MNNPRHFELDLAELKRSLVAMGNLVEQSLSLGVDALANPRVQAREEAHSIEERLDALDNEVEERAHRIIALQAPVASDLRLLISALRITNDLEQAGDLAESISKRASYIARHQAVGNPSGLPALGELVKRMVRECLQAFVSHDVSLSREVIAMEEDADRLTKECYREIQAAMAEKPDRIKEYTHLLRAVAHLEHIADIAVSIAEDAVYIAQGRSIRHHHEDLGAKA